MGSVTCTMLMMLVTLTVFSLSGVFGEPALQQKTKEETAADLLKLVLIKLDEELEGHDVPTSKDAVEGNVVKRLMDVLESHTHEASEKATNGKPVSGKEVLATLMKRDSHCGPQRPGDLCAWSNDCCCGNSCRRWRCVNPNEPDCKK